LKNIPFLIAFFAGVIFGWPTLVGMLVSEGVYQHECEEGTDPHGTCDARTIKLTYIFTAGPPSLRSSTGPQPHQTYPYSAATCQSLSPLPMGFFLDRFGTKRTIAVSYLLSVLGFLSMAFSLWNCTPTFTRLC